MTDSQETKSKRGFIKVLVKDKVIINQGDFGGKTNLWGNIFTIASDGKLEAELPKQLAEEGIQAGRYVKI